MNLLGNMVVYTDPECNDPLGDRVLAALADGNTRTFNQLEVLCSLPMNLISPATSETFADELDATLRELIADGRVLLVARWPELCFRKGTVLDQIVKGLEQDDA